jgi:hypothetical protein
MRTKSKSLLSLRNSLIILASFLLSIPAISQGNAGAVKLSYKYSSDSPVRYITTSKIIQDLDINGQSMIVNVISVLGCSIKSTSIVNNNLGLEVTIDTMAQSVDSPNGMTGGAVAGAIGKVFNMTISPEGKETDMSGAEQVSFTAGDGTTATAAQSFNEFFPDVPVEAMTPGYTWSGTDTLTEKTSSMLHVMIIKADNKFEGYELINGTNCVKILFTLSGTRDMKTQSQGMDIKMSGPFSGTGELYFSPEKGYFLKESVKTRMSGTMEITSPESMSFPVVMDITSITEVK